MFKRVTLWTDQFRCIRTLKLEDVKEITENLKTFTDYPRIKKHLIDDADTLEFNLSEGLDPFSDMNCITLSINHDTDKPEENSEDALDDEEIFACITEILRTIYGYEHLKWSYDACRIIKFSEVKITKTAELDHVEEKIWEEMTGLLVSEIDARILDNGDDKSGDVTNQSNAFIRKVDETFDGGLTPNSMKYTLSLILPEEDRASTMSRTVDKLKLDTMLSVASGVYVVTEKIKEGLKHVEVSMKFNMDDTKEEKEDDHE